MRFPIPIALALDEPERARVLALAEAAEPHVGVFKLGLTAFIGEGPQIVRELAARKPVFLDLKLHDIPAQVEGAAAAAASLGVELLTVHAGGGPAMVSAAAVAAPDVTVLGVTVLTSLGVGDLAALGIAGPPEEAVLRLGELALEAGAGGLVCSPLEVAGLRERFGPEPVLVVPGIRPAGAEAIDQRRTATPAEALAAGADLLVVGRPITAAPDPAAAARAILEEVI